MDVPIDDAQGAAAADGVQCPWGLPKAAQTADLADIMSEDLAHQLSSKEGAASEASLQGLVLGGVGPPPSPHELLYLLLARPHCGAAAANEDAGDGESDDIPYSNCCDNNDRAAGLSTLHIRRRHHVAIRRRSSHSAGLWERTSGWEAHNEFRIAPPRPGLAPQASTYTTANGTRATRTTPHARTTLDNAESKAESKKESEVESKAAHAAQKGDDKWRKWEQTIGDPLATLADNYPVPTRWQATPTTTRRHGRGSGGSWKEGPPPRRAGVATVSRMVSGGSQRSSSYCRRWRR